jgi:hypothetical protein
MKLVLRSNKLPENFDQEALAQRIETMLQGGYYVGVYVEGREGDYYEVKVTLSDPDTAEAYASGMRPIDYFAGKDVRKLIAQFDTVEPLGKLSAKYESRGDPGAYGNDRHGGPSYGAYQFASRPGSLANFLNFLVGAKPEFSKVLQAAGGDAAGRKGSQKFIDAWKKLARDHKEDFYKIQHAFVKMSHYDIFVRKVKQQLDLNIDARSLALKNVAWSTAVQHGPGNRIFRNALQGKNLSSDANIIKWVYAERSNVGKHFRSSTKAVQNAVKARFAKELKDALDMLASENA